MSCLVNNVLRHHVEYAGMRSYGGHLCFDTSPPSPRELARHESCPARLVALPGSPRFDAGQKKTGPPAATGGPVRVGKRWRVVRGQSLISTDFSSV